MPNPAQNERPSAPASRPSFLEKGGGWVVAQFVVMAAWLIATPVGRPLAESTSLRVLAVALLAVGAVIGVWGMLILGKSRTPFPKPPEHAQLVRHGIYAVIRHPLYASLIALSFGWACLWASWVGAALAVGQAILLDAKARHEERWLRGRFPDYAEYEAKVRRLIPWVW